MQLAFPAPSRIVLMKMSKVSNSISPCNFCNLDWESFAAIIAPELLHTLQIQFNVATAVGSVCTDGKSQIDIEGVHERHMVRSSESHTGLSQDGLLSSQLPLDMTLVLRWLKKQLIQAAKKIVSVTVSVTSISTIFS